MKDYTIRNLIIFINIINIFILLFSIYIILFTFRECIYNNTKRDYSHYNVHIIDRFIYRI